MNIHFLSKIAMRSKIMMVYLSAPLLLGGVGGGLVSCTDYDDYNTVPVDDLPSASNTLWENIASDPQLTKFAALAQKSKFSESLSSPRFYTVWAPVDASISDEEYNRLMASDSATIVKQFMQQHTTEYNHPVSAAMDSITIISLNAKHHPFTQSSFDGFSYSGVNMPATNGVMHKINGLSEFYPNLYENIDNLVGCDSIKAYIQKYDEEYLDVNASVIGPLVDGKQTWNDSVMKKRNNVIRSIMNAELEDEDSTYCMLIPTDEAWKAAYASIYPHYNYIPKLDYMDLTKKTTVASSTNATTAKADKTVETNTELQDSLTCRNIVSDLAFSQSFGYNQPLFGNGTFATTDSVLSTSWGYLTDAQNILNHTLSVSEMSNGIARIVDSLTFKSWETYNPVIATVTPEATLKVSKLTAHNIPIDSLAGRDTLFSKVPPMIREWLMPAKSQFFSYVAVDSANIDGTTGKPEFNFALRNVRSATYHIYVVTVPAQVEEPQALVKPYYLRFYLSWTDAANKQQYTVLPQGAKNSIEISTDNGNSTATMIYLGDPGRVNVIDLGEFTFPACYAGLDAYPSLMMMHTKSYTSSKNRLSYDQQMRVAGVFLVPRELNDFWANTNNE